MGKEVNLRPSGTQVNISPMKSDVSSPFSPIKSDINHSYSDEDGQE